MKYSGLVLILWLTLNSPKIFMNIVEWVQLSSHESWISSHVRMYYIIIHRLYILKLKC